MDAGFRYLIESSARLRGPKIELADCCLSVRDFHVALSIAEAFELDPNQDLRIVDRLSGDILFSKNGAQAKSS